MALRDKIVKIAYELKDKFSGRVGKITGSIRDVGVESDKTSAKIERNNRRASGSFDGLLAGANKLRFGFIALGAAILGVVSNIGKWTRAANIQERAETKLATSLRNLTDASTEQIQALKDQASELQETTGFGDELILSAQAQLATFKLTAEQIKQLTPLLVDMGESQRKLGNDTVDLESSALALGKTFTAGIGSLSRYGVALTDAEKEAFKLGDQQQKVDVVVKALTNNFGGLAEAVGKTYEGAARKGAAASGDLDETLGRLFTKNKSFIALQKIITKAWNDMAVGISGSAGEIGLVITGLVKTLVFAGNTLKLGFNAIQAGIKTATGVVVGSVALITKALSAITFGETSKAFELITDDLLGYVGDLADGIVQDSKDMNNALKGMGSVFSNEFGKAADESEKASKRITESSKKTTAQLESETKAAQAAAESQKVRAKALSDALKDSQAALKKDLENAKSVADEFQALINDVSGGGAKDAKDLTLIDFATGITDAQNALNAGDFDGAINGARQTADVIRKLKDEGAESSVVLIGLAQQLKQVADAAAQAKIQQDKNALAQSQNALQEKADEKPVVSKLVLDTAEAEAQLAEFTEKAAAAVSKTVFVNASGNAFSDRQGDGFSELAREALQKGTR